MRVNPTFATRATYVLESWVQAVERFWNDAGDGTGCYGPGYLHWGVQSNLNYVAAMATLASQPGVRESHHWQGRALAALRFALATHVTGGKPGNDGKPWGHSWISMLGIERAMHGIAHLEPYLTDEDRDRLRRLLVSEANWVLREARRGDHEGIVAGRWNSSGCNVPESNIWSGSLLWRTAMLFPDAPEAQDWRERAHAYLINGVSVEADATDHTRVAGKPISAWHVGANYFPSYALDHHGYLNVGYMVICVSNAAILHFDMRRAGLPRPESLDHHEGDLWQVLRRFIAPDGRLLRIGGDSRVRYAYCQEYLLPALLYAADALCDPHALGLAERQFALMEQETSSGDGAFYSARLSRMRDANPHYFTRLESDRACVLAMALNYLPLVQDPPPPIELFETSVGGGWSEPEHGAVAHRSPRRFASFSWRARGLTQALCLPPDKSNMAEWLYNLCPVVRFLGDDGQIEGSHRKLLRHSQHSFKGGFATCGSVIEGVGVQIDEGALCTDQATTHIAFAALPDGRTCVGLQLVQAAGDRLGYAVEVKGLHLVIPNDVFNGFQRRITSGSGVRELFSPPADDGAIDLDGTWACVDDSLGVVLLYGGESLLVRRSA